MMDRIRSELRSYKRAASERPLEIFVFPLVLLLASYGLSYVWQALAEYQP